MGLILGVITVNVIIGLAQEGKAEKAAEAIKAMLSASGARQAQSDSAVQALGRGASGGRLRG
jgi:magnesium-transporting ATPase (P-type)